MTESNGTPDSLRSLFQEIIHDHYRHPRNRRALENADVTIHKNSPTCGVDVTVLMRLEEGRITVVGFTGQGCSISVASASMMTELIGGLPLAEARDYLDRFRAMLHQGSAAIPDRSLGRLASLSGVARFPVRVKCAMLPWVALEDALPGQSDI
jgi:nitrogen fixation NifU-like protein